MYSFDRAREIGHHDVDIKVKAWRPIGESAAITTHCGLTATSSARSWCIKKILPDGIVVRAEAEKVSPAWGRAAASIKVSDTHRSWVPDGEASGDVTIMDA